MRFNARAAASLRHLGLGLYSLRGRGILTRKYLMRSEVLQWATSIDIEGER